MFYPHDLKGRRAMSVARDFYPVGRAWLDISRELDLSVYPVDPEFFLGSSYPDNWFREGASKNSGRFSFHGTDFNCYVAYLSFLEQKGLFGEKAIFVKEQEDPQKVYVSQTNLAVFDLFGSRAEFSFGVMKENLGEPDYEDVSKREVSFHYNRFVEVRHLEQLLRNMFGSTS